MCKCKNPRFYLDFLLISKQNFIREYFLFILFSVMVFFCSSPTRPSDKHNSKLNWNKSCFILASESELDFKIFHFLHSKIVRNSGPFPYQLAGNAKNDIARHLKPYVALMYGNHTPKYHYFLCMASNDRTPSILFSFCCAVAHYIRSFHFMKMIWNLKLRWRTASFSWSPGLWKKKLRFKLQIANYASNLQCTATNSANIIIHNSKKKTYPFF